MEDRYAGRGLPIWHDHLYSDNAKKRLDVLQFESGEYAVWCPETERCLSFFNNEYDATRDAVWRLDQIASTKETVYEKGIMALEDGFYYWWPEPSAGAMPAWRLREIADLLDEKNQPWQDQIEEYFSSDRQED